MIPVLFEFGPLRIYSYGFMLMVSFLVGYALLIREFKRLGKDPALGGDIVWWAGIGGISGSKLYYLVENYQDTLADPFGMIFSGAGLVFLGGLGGGMLLVTLYLHRRALSWMEMADILAPLLILCYGIGRIGCFLVGDDYGNPTPLPWGIAFPRGIPPTEISVHPTQLYETTTAVAIFLFLWRSRLRFRPGSGVQFSRYLLLAGAERFLVEFIRTNSTFLLGLTQAQWISLVMFAVGIALLVRGRGDLPRAGHRS